MINYPNKKLRHPILHYIRLQDHPNNNKKQNKPKLLNHKNHIKMIIKNITKLRLLDNTTAKKSIDKPRKSLMHQNKNIKIPLDTLKHLNISKKKIKPQDIIVNINLNTLKFLLPNTQKNLCKHKPQNTIKAINKKKLRLID
jgi:hypothetical protein